MKKDVADKWVKALRSGKYGQIKNRLKGKDGYCCMGVLCELYKPDSWRVTDDGVYWFESSGPDDQALPEEVQEWAGMLSSRGTFGIGSTLIDYNDAGKSFDYIADIIEKEVKDL